MKHYWDCSLCRIENKGKALRCRNCSGRLRGRDRLLHEVGQQRKTRRTAALLSALAAGAGQIFTGRWTTGIALAALLPLAVGLVLVGWGGPSYGHVFLVAAAVFVLCVASADAWFGPRRLLAPCQVACPATVDIPDYLQLSLDNEFQQAHALIRSRIPLVGVIGRVCPHPCEIACLRGVDGEPVAINGCKRFLADRHRERTREAEHGARGVVDLRGGALSVAVVGSGPAGIACAYYLSVLGVSVTVYEADSTLGGRLATTIPDYRLPPYILEEEIESVRDGGVAFLPNSPIGPAGRGVGELLVEHAAVFLAVGAEQMVPLAAPGAEAALDFQQLLRASKLDTPLELGRRVAVVGGGNAAMDVCRTALRLGAEEVHLLYRRTREEMPARADEVQEALREGVQFHYLSTVAEIQQEGGRVQGVQVQVMELGAADDSGRPRPVPVAGETWQLAVDAVIPTLGQTVTGGLFDDPALAGLKRTQWGEIWVQEDTQRTSLANIYAGGDAVSGAATAVQAMAQGRRAALAIFGDLAPDEVPRSRLLDRRIRQPFRGHVETPQARIREEMPKRSLRVRTADFLEVEEGLREPSACREAGRCLQCHREL